MRLKAFADLKPERLAGKVRAGVLELSEIPEKLRKRVENRLAADAPHPEPEPAPVVKAKPKKAAAKKAAKPKGKTSKK
jgi:hypothetical protein